MKHAVLGFLIDQPMHGYALKRFLSPALPRERRVNDGVLYPLLKRMEAEGLISGRTERRKGAPDRRVFHPTDAGRRAFSEWLEGSVEEDDEVAYDFMLGHPFLTKCLFFRELPAEKVASKVDDQLQAGEAKLADFRRIRSGMVERGADPYRIAVLDLGIAQQRERMRWLKQMRGDLDRSADNNRKAGKAA
jgi:PadR family transcriptional regulator, phenolic acid-responsive transcriptional regulator